MTASALTPYIELRNALSAERRGDGGPDLADALTGQLDASLRELADGLVADAAIVALGGYGRGEQCINSDIDVMLLHRCSDPEPLVRRILYPLWDSGLKVGHAVRTIEKNREEAQDDFETLTSLLSARLVTGDEELYADLMSTSSGISSSI